MHALILLHGALGTAQTLSPVTQLLSDTSIVYAPDLPGHGTRSHEHTPITIESLTSFLDNYIREHALIDPIVFGYSLGGYVALNHARLYPGVIKQVITYATKYHWNPEEAAKQVKMLQADMIEAKVPAFAQVLKDRHGTEHWRSVLLQTAHLMQKIGERPLLSPDTVHSIPIPVCIAVGSADQMVTQEESKEIAQSMPRGEFKVLEGLPHAIEKIPGKALAELILERIR